MNPKKLLLTAAAILAATSTASATTRYFDLNGTDPGFGVDNTTGASSPGGTPATGNIHLLDYSAAVWNSDPTGGAAGTLAALVNGDVAAFVVEGTGGVIFEWEQNTSDIELGGILASSSSTGSISRFQQDRSEGNGNPSTIRWSSGAILDAQIDMGFYWNLGTEGDYTKIGSGDMTLEGNELKIDGTLTIGDGGYVVVDDLDCVTTSSSFNFQNSSLLGHYRYSDDLDDGGYTVHELGQLTGSCRIVREGSSSNLADLYVSTSGIDLSNSVATDELRFGWSSSAILRPGAVTSLDINKSGVTLDADWINVDAASSSLDVRGSLVVNLLPGSDALVEGDSFTLFSANVVNAFSSKTLPTLDSGLRWDLSNLYVDGTITVVATSSDEPTSLQINYLPEDYEIVFNPDSLPTTGVNLWKYTTGSNARCTWGSTPAAIVGESDGFEVPLVDVTTVAEVVNAPFYNPSTAKLTSLNPELLSNSFSVAGAGNYISGEVLGWYEIVITTISGPVYTATSGSANMIGSTGTDIRDNMAAAFNTLSWDVDPFSNGGLLLSDIDDISMTVYGEVTVAISSTDSNSLFLNILRMPIGFTVESFFPFELGSSHHTGSDFVLNWSSADGLAGGVDVYRRLDLNTPPWVKVASNIETGTYSDSPAPSDQAFYILALPGVTP